MAVRGFLALHAQRRFVYLVAALLSVAGIWTATSIPSAIYPELRFSRITIVAEGTALGAHEMLLAVTRPIEEAVSVVPGVTRVQSRAIRGGSETNVTFTGSVDMTVALQQVQARVNQLRGDLPSGLDIQIERLSPSLFPILSYNLEGGDPATLYDIARYQIRPLLARVPGVARVDVMGSDIHEIEVVADPARLAAQGMTYEDLASAIRASATPRAVGRLAENYRQYLIVTANAAQSADEIGAIVVGHDMRVRDLASVFEGTEDHVRVIAGDGRPAALLNVSRQVDGNTVAIADSISRLAATLALPSGVHFKPLYDQAALVRDAVRSVRDAMIVGAVLAVLVLFVFLRQWRVTIISASAIPLTLMLSVLVMRGLGQTFNLMTLGAMAIAIGLVIDDAVVVTENIVRHLATGAERMVAIGDALRELLWPVTTSTLTTVVVFLPLGLLTGVEGQFFRALSLTLTIAVLVSLLVALTLIPLFSAGALEPGSSTELQPSRLVEWYGRALGSALRFPRWSVLAAVVLIVAGIAMWRLVGTGFLPEMDEGAFVMDYFTPGGTALDETDRLVHQAERILAETPEIAGTSRRTGAELGLFATQLNRGDLIARLKPRADRDRSSDEVIDDVRARIEKAVPKLHIEFVQILSDVINDLAGAARPVEIKLFGSDLDALEHYATVLAPDLRKIDGLEDFYDGISEPGAEITLSIDAAAAGRAGVDPSRIADQLSAALLGAPAGEIRQQDRTVGIRVRAPDVVRGTSAGFNALTILTGRGPVPVGALASWHRGDVRGELLRENQQQMIDLTADLAERSLGEVMRDVKAVLRSHPAPAGIRVEVAGQYAGQQAAFKALLLVLLLAAVSVTAVMVLQFRSFTEPLVVLFAAPLSFVGALVLLAVTGTPLNVSSFMGLILLIGLIVKNGIILLDFTRHLMERGHDARSALIEAGRVRLRPILMTTLCTLFGLIPLALGLGAGSELQRPLALAVIGGLACSTPITLFLVPALWFAAQGGAKTSQGLRVTPEA